MVHLDTPNALVMWDPDSRSVVLEWRNFVYGDEYRGALNAVLEALRTNGSNKVLSDSRRMKAISQDDQEWLLKDWVPRAGKAGLRHMAIVLPKSALGQMTLQRLAQAGPDKRLVSSDGTSYFETIEEAKRWFQSLP